MADEANPRAPILIRVDELDAVDTGATGAPVPVTREAIGPTSQLAQLGAATAVHDRRFPPGAALEEPKPATPQLWFVIAGELAFDDQRQGIGATMSAGDVGRLGNATDSARWRVRNDGQMPAHALVLGLRPASRDPEPAIDVVQADRMPQLTPAEGLSSTLLLGRGEHRLHEAIHEFVDTSVEVGVTLPIEVAEGQVLLLWCLDRRIQVDVDGSTSVTGVGVNDTVAIPATAANRQTRVAAQAPSRVLHAVMS